MDLFDGSGSYKRAGEVKVGEVSRKCGKIVSTTPLGKYGQDVRITYADGNEAEYPGDQRLLINA